MRAHVLLALVLFATGCAESAPADAPSSKPSSYQSGYRLRAHLWKSGETEVLIDWTDQALDTNCSYARFEDGSIRCAPDASAAFIGFSDSDCAEPAAYLDWSDPAPRYVRTTSQSCAGELPTVTVFALAGEGRRADQLYQRTGGACTATSLFGYRVFDISEASPSTFARARVATESRGAFDVEQVTCEDGSGQTGRVIDRERGGACAPLGAASDLLEARCLPANSGVPSNVTFADARCTEVGVWGHLDADACAPPVVAMRVSDAPGHPIGVFEVGAQAARHVLEGGACVEMPSSPPEPFFQLGRALDPSAFPAMKVTETGQGRLRAAVVTAPDDERPLAPYAAWGTFWDTELEQACDPQPFEDEIVRCVDRRTPSFTVMLGYADARCTQPVTRGDAGAPPPRYAIETLAAGAAKAEIVSVRPVIEPFAGATLYARGAGGGCAAVDVPAVERAWVLGDEVAFDDAFARVSEWIE